MRRVTVWRGWANWGGLIGIGLVASLAALAALNSSEKKATREAQSVADETAERVKKTCGNPKLDFVFDWPAFKELDYTIGGISRDETMRRAGDRANRVGNAMIALCSQSQNANLKEALSRVTQVKMSPHSDERNFRIEFTRQGGETLEARFGAFGVVATEDLTAEIRKQF